MANYSYWLKWLLVGVFASYAGSISAQEKKDKKAAAEAEATLQEKVAAVEESQAAMAANLAAVQEKLAATEAEKQPNADLTKQVADLSAKLDAATAENKAVDEEMKKQIASFSPGKGFKINGPGESSLTIAGLLQTRIETSKNASPDGNNWAFDAYIRRIRLMAYGQINKWVNFFIETDNANLGKGADWSPRMFIQDAYMELNLHKAFQIDLGLLLAPFSHHGMQAATSLLGMDYHSALIKYPAGSNLVWRDAGVMIRGMFAGDHIEYRLALLNGTRGNPATGDLRNPDDAPRLTGRLTFNVFDAEGGAGVGGFFYDGLYLAKTDAGITSSKKVLSFGVSSDWQKDLNVTLDPADGSVVDRTSYVGVAWDAFLDLPLGASKIMSLNGQVNGYFYNFGDRTTRTDEVSYYDTLATPDASAYTGLGLSSEFGFRYSWLQPLVLVDFYKSTQSENNLGDYAGVYGGFNVYLFGHATTFKIQAGADRKNKAPDWSPSFKFQAQLVF